MIWWRCTLVMMKTQSLLDQENMRHSTEASLTTVVKRWLASQDDVSFYKASDRYQIGISDYIICCGGIFVAAELKADKGTASPHQKIFIADIIKAGGVGGVCYTLRDVKDLIQIARKRGEYIGV